MTLFGSLDNVLWFLCVYSWNLLFLLNAAQEAVYCTTSNESFPRQNKSGLVKWILEFYSFLFNLKDECETYCRLENFL